MSPLQEETMVSSVRPVTTIISECRVKPASLSEESSKTPHYLTPWDLPSLNFEYMEFGLLFNKPHDGSMHTILDQLKNSLATTLTHFFPLSGRLVTQSIQDPPSYCVYVDCKDPAGAKFVHAVASSVTVSDILSPHVPFDIIKTLFASAPGTINAHGHTIPLLAVQVTQLRDGIFISFSLNHALADGTSLWHFINSYSEACRATKKFQNNCRISRPPVTSPWFWNGQVHVLGSHPTVQQSAALPSDPSAYRHRVFHFTYKAIAQLKKRANEEYRTQKITSYKALAALIWRSATRARGLKTDQITTCAVPVNCRSKVEPPLSNEYFGNCLATVYVSRTADELLSNNLGWAAWQLHNEIVSYDDKKVRSYLEQFTAADCSVPVGDPGLLYLGSSPWNDVYGNDFGWGTPVAVRWSCEMVDGYVHILPGCDKGSIDVTMSLFAEVIDELELDNEFMNAQHPRICSSL